MSANSNAATVAGPEASEVFDQAHLAHYTMNIPELAAEVVGLFLTQLPSTLAMIETAASTADWKLATHSLKGASASIGARRLQKLALELEDLGFDGDRDVRALRIQVLKAAVVEFRETVAQIYP